MVAFGIVCDFERKRIIHHRDTGAQRNSEFDYIIFRATCQQTPLKSLLCDPYVLCGEGLFTSRDFCNC